ncbi:MAG: BlaI/MecI/CopY family transcriptional regulator [Proteobacteria bacterium]|nr:BlaI/MecI/CopY family transcriptional regulator [Pseudomonadota bacterium]
MARPRAKELTERELELMHAFWQQGEITVAQAREVLNQSDHTLAYTTVATLVRILTNKGFLKQTNQHRPFRYQPVRSFEEVSGSLLGELMQNVFGGSREQLLMRLVDQKKLTSEELALLEDVLREQKK